jgi:hypothetical protein
MNFEDQKELEWFLSAFPEEIVKVLSSDASEEDDVTEGAQGQLEAAEFILNFPSEVLGSDSENISRADEVLATSKFFRFLLIAEEIGGCRAVLDRKTDRLITFGDKDFGEVHEAASAADLATHRVEMEINNRRSEADHEKFEALMKQAKEMGIASKWFDTDPMADLFAPWLKKDKK